MSWRLEESLRNRFSCLLRRDLEIDREMNRNAVGRRTASRLSGQASSMCSLLCTTSREINLQRKTVTEVRMTHSADMCKDWAYICRER